jgi:hypothetical protein
VKCGDCEIGLPENRAKRTWLEVAAVHWDRNNPTSGWVAKDPVTPRLSTLDKPKLFEDLDDLSGRNDRQPWHHRLT